MYQPQTSVLSKESQDSLPKRMWERGDDKRFVSMAATRATVFPWFYTLGDMALRGAVDELNQRSSVPPERLKELKDKAPAWAKWLNNNLIPLANRFDNAVQNNVPGIFEALLGSLFGKDKARDWGRQFADDLTKYDPDKNGRTKGTGAQFLDTFIPFFFGSMADNTARTIINYLDFSEPHKFLRNDGTLDPKLLIRDFAQQCFRNVVRNSMEDAVGSSLPYLYIKEKWRKALGGSFEGQVAHLAKHLEKLPANNRENLSSNINQLLKLPEKDQFTGESLVVEKYRLSQVLRDNGVNSLDKFLGDLKAHMGEAYPLTNYKVKQGGLFQKELFYTEQDGKKVESIKLGQYAAFWQVNFYVYNALTYFWREGIYKNWIQPVEKWIGGVKDEWHGDDRTIGQRIKETFKASIRGFAVQFAPMMMAIPFFSVPGYFGYSKGNRVDYAKVLAGKDMGEVERIANKYLGQLPHNLGESLNDTLLSEKTPREGFLKNWLIAAERYSPYFAMKQYWASKFNTLASESAWDKVLFSFNWKQIKSGLAELKNIYTFNREAEILRRALEKNGIDTGLTEQEKQMAEALNNAPDAHDKLFGDMIKAAQERELKRGSDLFMEAGNAAKKRKEQQPAEMALHNLEAMNQGMAAIAPA